MNGRLMNKDEYISVSRAALVIYMRGMPPIAYPEHEEKKEEYERWYAEYFAARDELRKVLGGNE